MSKRNKEGVEEKSFTDEVHLEGSRDEIDLGGSEGHRLANGKKKSFSD